jgi:hypothetical protein
MEWEACKKCEAANKIYPIVCTCSDLRREAEARLAEANAEIERLRKGILAALSEYGDAQSDGCDANGAWDCVREAVDALLERGRS